VFVSFLNKQGVVDRLETAAKARSEMLARFRARPRADDPAVLARQSARRAVIDAREARAAEREAARQAEIARAAALAEAERLAEIERKHAEQLAAQERAKALQAEQKAQRDARYLARKAKAQKRR
jgi:hypothetical protein